ncbi:hypothetical protein ABIF64_004390 [Bradyrhizobium japonicum]|uniref:Peptidase M23 n=2 Tax=Nitrobacteraceae TaxID=41294 RepID=A0ABV2S2R6_BRAJP|nr:hypothetical protein [Bradyrhizobium japonicum]MCP1789923.1 hypothetical protein [Bradyrhizobium japonicum]MCP1802419.1 hypothetical protein [Bradyrhizobium japonicum]MCP1820730.1 hypothetical protein [Bradyrhizobium japonicum]MCP1867763.1 hypothetical protein [Bradyrhizobium japonicum]
MPKYRVLNHQGRSMSAPYPSISSGKLSGPIGTANAPALIDARIDEVVSADPRRRAALASLRSTSMRNTLFAFIGLGACLLGSVSEAQAQNVDWQKVDETLGRKPAVSDDVHRYGFPRSDLSVTLDGVTIKPALALGGWVAFKPAHGGAMVMGDLVLLETEINPVMAKMIANGLEITAIHNHLLRASPATFYMHVAGHGDPVKLASAIHDALAESKTPLTVAAPASPAPAVDLDTAKLDQIIGSKGQANGGVYQFNVKRRDPITQDGMPLTPVAPMGVAIGINFQPTGGGKAAITGDFVLTGNEVNPVILALRTHGIEVTALHSHMLDEQPRLFFMHFWANDDAVKLAEGLRAALDKTASTKS